MPRHRSAINDTDSLGEGEGGDSHLKTTTIEVVVDDRPLSVIPTTTIDLLNPSSSLVVLLPSPHDLNTLSQRQFIQLMHVTLFNRSSVARDE